MYQMGTEMIVASFDNLHKTISNTKSGNLPDLEEVYRSHKHQRSWIQNRPEVVNLGQVINNYGEYYRSSLDNKIHHLFVWQRRECSYSRQASQKSDWKLKRTDAIGKSTRICDKGEDEVRWS